jgi:hypothetical protein
MARNCGERLPIELGLLQGVHGMRNSGLLGMYQETLDQAYDFFLQRGRPEPTKDQDGRVPVFVFAVDDPAFGPGSPCMDDVLFVDSTGIPSRIVPALALPSRIAEPDLHEEEMQIRAAAVHELSHLFNGKFLPYLRLGSAGLETRPEAWLASWLWLDEGIAVAAEGEIAQLGIIPPNNDWLGYTQDWLDRPERSLDNLDGRYQAVLFVRYVNRLMIQHGDPGFLNRVWQLSQSVWNTLLISKAAQPYAAITALAETFSRLSNPLVFCAAHVPDVFASGFCFDSYFLHHPGSLGHEPLVFKRFTDRSVTRWWELNRCENIKPNPPEFYPLPGLACRYFRFFPGDQGGVLTVRVAAKSGHKLKAELALAEPNSRFYVSSSKQTGVPDVRNGTNTLVCGMQNFSKSHCDHAVLVVTNCSIKEDPLGADPPTGDPDETQFTVEAEVT